MANENEEFFIECKTIDSLIEILFANFSPRAQVATFSSHIIGICKKSKDPKAAFDQAMKAFKILYDDHKVYENDKND